MKAAWLKFILSLTNRIYRQKRALIEEEGLGIIKNAIILLFLEFALDFVSLPLYLGVRTDKVVAFFREKGTYEKVAYDYRLRRVFTLTGVGIIFLIWIFKLSVILLTPKIVGPMQLYKVINFSPQVLTEDTIEALETEIQTAPFLDTIKRPEIQGVEKLAKGSYAFYGKGQPSTTVVLFLQDRQTAIYTDTIDENGNWRIVYTKKDFRLNEGNHALSVFCYSAELGGRSRLSDQQYFKVTSSWADRFVENLDNILNIFLVIIISLGVFLMVLIV